MVRNPTTFQEKAQTFQLKQQHIYLILLVVTLVAFIFFSEEKIIGPKYGMVFGFLLLGAVAMGESWEAMRRKGSIIITTIGAYGINPVEDIFLAVSHDKSLPNLCCIATGGFIYGRMGFAFSGKDQFIVCPPEHLTKFAKHYICKTSLRRVHYDQLPKYVQDRLHTLPRFPVQDFKACTLHNIWFGLCSSYNASDTDVNFAFEEEMIKRVDKSNTYSHYLDDIIDQRVKLQEKPKNKYEILELKDNGGKNE